jgi:hypothetical protein
MESEGCRILVCHGPDCTEGNSETILHLFDKEIHSRTVVPVLTEEHVIGGRPVNRTLLRERLS